MNFLVFPEAGGRQVAINVNEVSKVVFAPKSLVSKTKQPVGRDDARLEFHVKGEGNARVFTGDEAVRRWGQLQAVGALGLEIESQV